MIMKFYIMGVRFVGPLDHFAYHGIWRTDWWWGSSSGECANCNDWKVGWARYRILSDSLNPHLLGLGPKLYFLYNKLITLSGFTSVFFLIVFCTHIFLDLTGSNSFLDFRHSYLVHDGWGGHWHSRQSSICDPGKWVTGTWAKGPKSTTSQTGKDKKKREGQGKFGYCLALPYGSHHFSAS